MRIGLIGGSFDPVHQAHLALARMARDHLQLDEVRWLPVGQAWQKARALTPARHRLAMVELAIEGEANFLLDPIETLRDGPSYTLDTVKALQAQVDPAVSHEWVLVIGQDQYANLHTWHAWPELLASVTLAVACRGAQNVRPNPVLRQVAHRVVELPLPPLEVSSTDIRTRLGRGEDVFSLVPTLVPSTVAGYIATHQLYAHPGNPR